MAMDAVGWPWRSGSLVLLIVWILKNIGRGKYLRGRLMALSIEDLEIVSRSLLIPGDLLDLLVKTFGRIF